MIEDTFDKIMNNLEDIEKKLVKKVEAQEKGVKNSCVHFVINTEEKKKLMKKAEDEGIHFSEWCRKKLRENSQLDRIERKIDKLLS